MEHLINLISFNIFKQKNKSIYQHKKEQTFLVKEEEMSPPHKDTEVVISDDEEYETEIVTSVCKKIQSPLSYISPVQVDFGGQPVHFMPKFRTFRKCELAAALKGTCFVPDFSQLFLSTSSQKHL